jgi:cell division protein FtsQ
VIARQLETDTPIAEAVVTRRMFPPGVIIHIQERHPVATVYNTSSAALPSKNFDTLFPIALIDEKGTWMPYEKFATLNQSQKLPALKVVGMQQQYQSQWASLYQAVSRSPIKISVVDWREPSNLILRTEIGMVHFGPLGSRFPQQLQALDQMRKLPEKLDKDEIDYIDLSNPDMPMVELTSSKELIKPPEDTPSR